MKIKKIFQSIKWFMLISGIMIVILGITMLFTPLKNLVAMALFIGICMLVSGVSEIVSFFNENKDKGSGWLMLSGIVTTILSIWIIFGKGSNVLISLLVFIFGVWVMASNIFRIVDLFTLGNHEEIAQWGWSLGFSILGSLLGFLLMFSPIISSVIISYAIAFMLISYGSNNILIFFRMRRFSDYIHRNSRD
ncbi:MAG TPA: DUF308 domain-containing protein [Candidatus Merdenecus merdavium]|nr:DUF308 domain-containing protein [Candidatus Merdenecus merdavium]